MTKIKKSMAAFVCLALMFTVATVLHADDYQELADFVAEEAIIEQQRRVDELNSIAHLFFEYYTEGALGRASIDISLFNTCPFTGCTGSMEPRSSSTSHITDREGPRFVGSLQIWRNEITTVTSTWIQCSSCDFTAGHSTSSSSAWGPWH